MLKLRNPRVCKHPYDMPWKACCICSADTNAGVESVTLSGPWGTWGVLAYPHAPSTISMATIPMAVFEGGIEIPYVPVSPPETVWFTRPSWTYDPVSLILIIQTTDWTSPPTKSIAIHQPSTLIEVRKYPICMMVKHEGKWYCREHFTWRFKKQMMDEPIDIVEEELDVD